MKIDTEPQTPSIFGTIRNNFTFKTEWWEDADGAYITDHEKYLFVKTILDFGCRGIIPENCDSKEHLKTADDRIRWSALVKCADYIVAHDNFAKKGKKGAKARWGEESDDDEQPEEKQTTERPVAELESKINPRANIRCKDIEELKGWFEKFKQNAKMIVLQDFSGKDDDWKGIFEYLDNNDWKISHGKECIVWGNFTKAVKWAWTGVKDRRMMMQKISNQTSKENEKETPGDSLRHNDDLRKRMDEKFGPGVEA